LLVVRFCTNGAHFRVELLCIDSSYHVTVFFFLPIRDPPSSTLFPYTTLFRSRRRGSGRPRSRRNRLCRGLRPRRDGADRGKDGRSEEHTSELQSLAYLVCRLLLEKKKQHTINRLHYRL